MISSQVEEEIIQKYILGHSRDEIAKDVKVATGTVSNKINEWKKKLDTPDIEDLRRSAVNMRNSGITIKHCIQGFRFLQILKRLGITIDNDDIDSDLDDLSFFVNDIYKRCKEVGMTPIVINAWIADLLNFSTENYRNLYENSKNDTKWSLNKNQPNEKGTLTVVSIISDFIEQKKREFEVLFEKRKKIEEEINQYEIQKRSLGEEIKTLEHQRQSIIGFHNIFTKLSNVLRDDCGIDLKKDLVPLANLFNDFKENGYDVTSIVAEYNKAVRLEWEIKYNETQIKAYQNQLTDLSKEIKTYESLLSIHKKNFDIYKRLETMKFGIDELHQLWLTVSEIAKERGDPSKDFDMIENPVAFFIKDVEDNYYEKLKFEDKVKEKRNELTQVNEQLSISRQFLHIQPFIEPLLVSLYKKDITEQEIIDMNQLFQNYLLEASNTDKTIDDKNGSNTNVKTSVNKAIGYKTFIDELKKYGGIKAAIKHQSQILDEIKNKNSDLIEQREALLELCQNAIILINMLNNHYFYYKGIFDHFYKMNGVSIVADRLSIPVFILVQNAPEEDKNSKEKDTKSDTAMSSNNDNNNNKSKSKD